MRKILLISFIFISLTTLTGCWNYREVNLSVIVAGVAIDKNDDNTYHLTAELVHVGGSSENGDLVSKKVEADGITLFDTIRKMIKSSGRRLFWSHSKVIIISQDVAKEGILPILDFFMRNDELRISVYPIVSKEKTAKEILQTEGITNNIICYELTGLIEEHQSQISISQVDLKKFISFYSAEGISATIPSIEIVKIDDKDTIKLEGSGIFDGDKLVGFLDEEETQYQLFIQDEIDYGIYPVKINEDIKDNITLEIIDNKTKIKPIYKNDKLSINIEVQTQVGISSLGSNHSKLDEKALNEFKSISEKQLKQSIENTIKQVQQEYGIDIFGFGRQVKADIPNVWKKVADDWKTYFKDLEVNVKVKIDITTTSLSNKSIKKGD